MKKVFILSVLISCVLVAYSQTVIDYDKNEYPVVKIGDQEWLGANLRSTHYSDGTLIKGIMKYKDSDAGTDVYGLLYTWDAAMHDSVVEGIQGVCPCGWHVPSKSDWQKLFKTAGGASVAAIHLKEQGTSHWKAPNTGDNSTGFNALPAGLYNSDPRFPIGFLSRGEVLGLWTSTASSNGKAIQYAMANKENMVIEFNWLRTDGYSIRCVKNSSSATSLNSKKAGDHKGDMTIFPNPAVNTSSVSVVTSIPESFEIDIIDSMGRNVGHKLIDRTGSLDISMLPKGFYLLKTDYNKVLISKKLVVL